MINKKIVIAGGTGFIGQEMIKYFGKDNQLIILTRQLPDTKTNRNDYNSLKAEDLQQTRFVKWDARPDDLVGRAKTVGDPMAIGWAKELESADIVINLAGKTVNCRYTAKNKKEILDSRVNSTSAIGDAIQQCTHPPKLWINTSSATVYPYSLDKPQDESVKEFAEGFSVDVCKAWEKAVHDKPTPSTRKVILRMAITLGPGGVLIPYFNLIKFGLGGKQGSGKQVFSWIHIEDSCRMIEWIEEHKELNGVYNCSSPGPVTNKEFMRLLRKATGNKFGLPAFTWMLKAGAVLIGTETELVLKSRWVIPTRILETGFQFRYPELEIAFNDIIKKIPRKQYHLF